MTQHTETIDQENPEWTEADFKKAISFNELPENLKKTLRGHGKQKKLIKQAVSIRLSPEVVDYFKGTGKGWQTRMDEVLKDYVSHH